MAARGSWKENEMRGKLVSEIPRVLYDALEGTSNRLTSIWQFSREYRSCPRLFLSDGRRSKYHTRRTPTRITQANRAQNVPFDHHFPSGLFSLSLALTRLFISFNAETRQRKGICRRVYINSSCCAAVIYALAFRKWMKKEKLLPNFALPLLVAIALRNLLSQDILYCNVINFKLDEHRC